MLRLSSVFLAGTLVSALSMGAVPVGFAADQPDQPVLWSDANPAPVPPFALPSDAASAKGMNQTFMFRTDPTGQLVPNLPSAKIPSEIPNVTNDQFLTYSINDPKRIDTTQTACEYYHALEAITHVNGCDTNGKLESLGDIVTFEKWKHDVKIDKYAPKGETDIAHFINLVDLNLTRDHHMVSYGPDQLAAYVCNHAGPTKTAADPTGLFPTQSEVNGLIKTIKSKDSLIACVAMEYSTRGYPGKPPFTMFFIFGANGALLSTVDLDGRGPKGVPNVCTACHGGTLDYNTSFDMNKTSSFDQTKNQLHYNRSLPEPAASQPSNIRPVGDLGAHFLPFDKGNFAFSDKLTPAEQEEAIFKLNLDVYTTEISRVKLAPDRTIMNGGIASASITDLISGWYNDKLTRNNPAPGFDTNNVPPIWDYYNYNEIYLKSYAHSCRTCHVAMENAPLERDVSSLRGGTGALLVCNQHVMPNAKVTFDRFWLSDPNLNFPPVTVPGQSPTAPNQPDLLNEILACNSFNNP